jgi:hypothetical protein
MGYIKDAMNKEPSTQAQRNKIIELCIEKGIINKRTNTQYTNESFREMFKLVFTTIPNGDVGWPSVKDWTNGLSMTQAKSVISYLIVKLNKKGNGNFSFGDYKNVW